MPFSSFVHTPLNLRCDEIQIPISAPTTGLQYSEMNYLRYNEVENNQYIDNTIVLQ